MRLEQLEAGTHEVFERKRSCDELQEEQLVVVIKQVRQVLSQGIQEVRLVEESTPATVPAGQELALTQELFERKVSLMQEEHREAELQVRHGLRQGEHVLVAESAKVELSHWLGLTQELFCRKRDMFDRQALQLL